MPEPEVMNDWQHALSDAVQAISTLPPNIGERLDEEANHDLGAMRACASQILSLVDDPEADPHELRNLAGAMRGYAEMLLEVLPPQEQELAAALNTVLAGTGAPGAPAPKQAPTALRQVPTDPGFILAVDDREENRELLARYLTRSGHFVVTAPDGEQALETLANTDVDVVLLDRRMPGMDGLEVLARIKAEPRWRATPVIMISGEQDMQGIVDCIEAGAEDYLFKPFNPVLLQARIKAGIERKRWHDREEQYREQLERNERFIRATFGRYLSDEIVTEILERPEGLELG
jgi:adenylate cyclase